MLAITNMLKESTLPVYLLDTKGTVLWVNQAFIILTGYQADELIGRHIHKLYTDTESDILVDLNRNPSLHNFHIRIRCKDGLIKVIQLNINTYQDENGEASHICYNTDITALQQVEEYLQDERRAKEEAKIRAEMAEEHQNELKTLNATISHEVRGLQQGIIGSVDMLEELQNSADRLIDNIPDSQIKVKLLQNLQEQREWTNRISLCIGHQAQVVNQVLPSKIKLKNIPFNLHELIKNVINMSQPKIREKGLNLTAKIPTEELILEGDPAQLTSILHSLISNAIKFTDKGVINVRVNIISQDSYVMTLAIKIKDTGIGIKKDEQARLFIPFQQANNEISKAYGGSGLGLSISRDIAKLMGGDITLNSEFGHGSEFTVTLSLKKSTLEQLRSIAPTVSVEPIRRHSFDATSRAVLVAEDNAVVQKALQGFLTINNQKCLLVDDGEALLRAYQTKPDDYALILMDNKMPGMDGVEATKRIRHFESLNSIAPIPICFLSGNADDEIKKLAFEAGANDYFVKPITKTDISIIIKKWIITELSLIRQTNQTKTETSVSLPYIDGQEISRYFGFC